MDGDQIEDGADSNRRKLARLAAAGGSGGIGGGFSGERSGGGFGGANRIRFSPSVNGRGMGGSFPGIGGMLGGGGCAALGLVRETRSHSHHSCQFESYSHLCNISKTLELIRPFPDMQLNQYCHYMQ